MRYGAIILCGGEAWRLKPATWTPKPLLKISQTETLVDRQIRWLLEHDFSTIVLASDREFPESSFVSDDAVKFSLERKKLGTGGAVKAATTLVTTEKFYVMNVDDMVFYDPRTLFQYAEEGAAVLLAKPQLPFGRVVTEDDFVTKFESKPLVEVWVSVGHYVFSKELVKRYFPREGNLELTTMQEMADAKYLKGLKYEGNWLTVNTMKDLIRIREYFESKRQQ